MVSLQLCLCFFSSYFGESTADYDTSYDIGRRNMIKAISELYKEEVKRQVRSKINRNAIFSALPSLPVPTCKVWDLQLTYPSCQNNFRKQYRVILRSAHKAYTLLNNFDLIGAHTNGYESQGPASLRPGKGCEDWEKSRVVDVVEDFTCIMYGYLSTLLRATHKSEAWGARLLPPLLWKEPNGWYFLWWW